MNFSYRCGWLFFRLLFATYFRWRVIGADNVPKTGGVILAANHVSYLDPPLVGAGLHRLINYLARQSLFRFPLVGRLLLSWHSVPVDREGGGARGLRIIMDRLLKGDGIILFPEGTRSHDGKLQPAQAGIGLVVAKTDAPVVPVRIFGTYEAWGRNKTFPRPRRITVRYGQPMGFETLRAEARQCSKERLKVIYQEIADEIMRAIGALSED